MSLFLNHQEEKFCQDLVTAFVAKQINLNPARLSQILSLYPNLWQGAVDNFFELQKLEPKWLQKWPKNINLTEKIEEFRLQLSELQIEVLDCYNPNYPLTLKFLSDYPVVLYFQGNLSLFSNTQMLTVVGSRRFTNYAELLMQKILAPACQLGVGTISGLALGIDTLAHKIAIEKNAATIGVIGSGLDPKSFYPKENIGLKKQILEQNGLVVSEYPPLTSATLYTFPQRNRILAALSDLTWVVAASQKSGSLITAAKARDLGKTVATSPGSIFDENLAGNLQLLKAGANLISEPNDILELLGLKTFPQIQPQPTLQFATNLEEKIYNLLSLSPQNVEILAEKLSLEINELNTNLTMLELNSLAKNLGENTWIRQ